MGRVVSDLHKKPPTSVSAFFDGRCPACRRLTARFRRLGTAGRRDLLPRDLADYPHALKTFGIGAVEARRGIHVVDRTGALRSGADALIALWRELPGWRWCAALISLPVLHGAARLLLGRVHVPSAAAHPKPKGARHD